VVWNPNVEARPHPFGEAGVRSSLEEVCRRAAKGASEILGTPQHLARVRTYSAKILKEAKAAGRQVHRPGHRARELLSAVQERKLWIPDPIGIEYIPAAHLMACDGPTHDDGSPCLAGDDCDGKVVLLAAMFMSVGLYTMIVGHSYDSSGVISHVLTKVYYDGKWHYADPSQLSNGTHQAIGKCVSYTRERYYSMPEIKVVCDGSTCDTRNFDPEDAGFVDRGTFVGLNGIQVDELPPELTVRWLGENEEIPESCKTAPYSLDRYTLRKYAERCGTDLALAWVSKNTGVDVSGCGGKGAKASAECVANNYGATIDLIDKDGNVKWDHVVQDAGAVAGIIVCAAVGAELAATVCGKIGAQIATIAADMGEAILDFFWGGSDGGGWACGKPPFNGIMLPQMARDIASFMKVAKTYGYYPPDTIIGPPIFNTVDSTTMPNFTGMRYWSRMMLLRGMAQATAAIAAEISEKTGASGAQAIQAMAPLAPIGWADLVNPLLYPTTHVQSGAPTPDYQGNVGGLLTVTIRPDISGIFMPGYAGDKPIVPKWMLPSFWTGVAPPDQAVWRYFMVVGRCPTDTVVWGDIEPNVAKKVLATPAGKPGHDSQQSYIVYSVPTTIEHLVVDTDDATFKKVLDLWKKSLSVDNPAKISRARALAASSGRGSTLAKVAAVGVAGAAAYFGWRYFVA
jgi:hypothetical protein